MYIYTVHDMCIYIYIYEINNRGGEGFTSLRELHEFSQKSPQNHSFSPLFSLSFSLSLCYSFPKSLSRVPLYIYIYIYTHLNQMQMGTEMRVKVSQCG